MPSPVKPSHSASAEGEKHHKQLDREIRDMVSAITHRVTGFHKPSSGSTPHHLESDGEEHGVSMITLLGNNTGATMRKELDEKSSSNHNHSAAHDDEPEEALSTYVNSNFQAINNSIMLGGSYQANDPGVHMDITDFFSTEPPQESHHKAEKHGKKGKKKEKEAPKTKHHSSHSD